MPANEAARWLRQGEDLQRSTLIELFFDLVFVFALTQLSATLAANLDWSNAFKTLLLTMAVWWVWSVTTWATDLYAQRAGLRALVIVLMFGVLLLSSAVPEAFAEGGLAFAVIYVALQMGRTSTLLLVTWQHPLSRRPARILFWFFVSATFWLAGAFLHESRRVILWAVAVGIEYTSANLGWPTPFLGRSALSEWDVIEEHLAERYRQILIIGLGDMVLTMGLVYAKGRPAATQTLALAASFATTVVLWQIYAYRAGERITTAFAPEIHRGRPARKLDWDHLIMVAGIVVTAVGTKLVIAHPQGRAPWSWIVILLGGPALFLIGRIHFGYVVFGHLSMPRVVGLAVLGAMSPAMRLLSPVLTAISVTVVLLGIISPDLPDLWRPAHFMPPNARRMQAATQGAVEAKAAPAESGPADTPPPTSGEDNA
jgi:low temperature requirement protein LtrA